MWDHWKLNDRSDYHEKIISCPWYLLICDTYDTVCLLPKRCMVLMSRALLRIPLSVLNSTNIFRAVSNFYLWLGILACGWLPRGLLSMGITHFLSELSLPQVKTQVHTVSKCIEFRAKVLLIFLVGLASFFCPSKRGSSQSFQTEILRSLLDVIFWLRMQSFFASKW